EGKNGGILNAATLQGNVGSGVVLSGAGSVILGGAYTIDQPLTIPAGNFLSLGGTFFLTAPISAAAATVYITGTLDNTGKTLALDASTGSWVMRGGTIKSGTIQTAGGA